MGPCTSMIAVLNLILGTIGAAGLALVHEMRADAFRSAKDLQSAAGLQVIGQIPLSSVDARGDLIQYQKDKPTTPAVETVRNLRTSIFLSNVDNPPQAIMSTSMIPAQGKTTQVIALVQNPSGLGKKVLIVESSAGQTHPTPALGPITPSPPLE